MKKNIRENEPIEMVVVIVLVEENRYFSKFDHRFSLKMKINTSQIWI
jgi:hypothetical protein